MLLLMVAVSHKDWGQECGCEPGGALATVAAADADAVLELLLMLLPGLCYVSTRCGAGRVVVCARMPLLFA